MVTEYRKHWDLLHLSCSRWLVVNKHNVIKLNWAESEAVMQWCSALLQINHSLRYHVCRLLIKVDKSATVPAKAIFSHHHKLLLPLWGDTTDLSLCISMICFFILQSGNTSGIYNCLKKKLIACLVYRTAQHDISKYPRPQPTKHKYHLRFQITEEKKKCWSFVFTAEWL